MTPASVRSQPQVRDYSLTGPEAERAAQRGLVSADWYQPRIDRSTMKQLVARSNKRATRDTLLWLGLLCVSGALAALAWGTWWAIPAFAAYGTLYGSASDARWHECGHRTAFRAQWANSATYYLASFMTLREPVSWRWSHARHHEDTIIVGRDAEIAVPRPTPLWKIAVEFVALRSAIKEFRKLALNVVGRLTAEEGEFVPFTEHRRAIWSGRAFVAVWVVVIGWSISIGSIEPLMFIGLPSFYGRWLLVVYGLTQHAGLAEDVLDHRLNSRTVEMNAIHRFMYLNMNYHIEHHMFPTVPYHALPQLHILLAPDLPPAYPSIGHAYREILPALQRQANDPTYFVRRALPRSDGEVSS